MKLEDFVSVTNLVRYQRMLHESRSEAERTIIKTLLAEELARQKPARLRTKRDSTQSSAEPGA